MEVLEIGFGSGLNIPYYPAGLKRVRAVDPATAGRKLAAKRAAACDVPIEYIGADAEALPVGDASVDYVLSTWTLCTIPDAVRALAEIRRVLRPGGAFRFVEHGLAPDAGVARRQQWLTPLQCRAFGGCHLNRRIDQLVAAAGCDAFKHLGPVGLAEHDSSGQYQDDPGLVQDALAAPPVGGQVGDLLGGACALDRPGGHGEDRGAATQIADEFPGPWRQVESVVA